MAGRPRVITDERLIAAVLAVVRRMGPTKLTLADVAREAGVSTGALVQRFGSKRGMLLAVARSGDLVRGMRAAFEAAPDPVEGIHRAMAYGMERDLTPDEFANSLAFLHLDLSDPEFREVLADFQAGVRAELRDYLTRAVEHGALSVPDVDALAEVINILRHGVQIAWAIDRNDSLAATLRRGLDTVLAPYLSTKDGR